MFKAGAVSLVVRLNKKQYDRQRFMSSGLKHVDLYFLDGSCPPRDIMNKFIYIAEKEPGAIAVHCKVLLRSLLSRRIMHSPTPSVHCCVCMVSCIF